MQTLKAVEPKIINEGRIKMMISGKSGVGKTMFALEFPKVYMIDTEGGAVRPQYRKKMTLGGAMYVGKEQGSQDFNSLLDEVRSLTTVKHDYKTLVIDSFSKIYNIARSDAEEKIGNEFGRDKKEANRPTRKLMRSLDILDMNVILVCHQMDKWERKNGQILNTGTTFDGFDKLEFDLDLWIEIIKNGGQFSYLVKKSRIEAFPEGNMFALDYSKFADLYGRNIIEKESMPYAMASSEQVEKIEKLIKILNIDILTTEKWFKKADVDSFTEMTEEQIGKCIEYVEKKLEDLKFSSLSTNPSRAVNAGKKGVK